MQNRQIFFDPDRKRWKRLRRIIDLTALVFTLALAGFIFNIFRMQRLPELLLPTPRHNYKALDDRHPLLREKAKTTLPAHRKTATKPSDVTLNSGEGLRAAYYVPYDPTSYTSFKEHVHQIDLLFPEWLHVKSSSPVVYAIHSDTHVEYPIISGNVVRDPDDMNRIKRVIEGGRVNTEIFPHLNNFDSTTQTWDEGVGKRLAQPEYRASIRQQVMRFLAAMPEYRGLSLDFENLPDEDEDGYLAFVRELYAEMRPKGLRLYVNVEVAATDNKLRQAAANSDGLILMNYDLHQITSEPGPIAPQNWFADNLRHVLRLVPKERLICAVGSYGYDWVMTIPNPKSRKKREPEVRITLDLSVPDALQKASDSGAKIGLDYDSLNPRFEFVDQDANERHVVWFLDAVTMLNQMRVARELGIQTFALWRLGEEDTSVWNIWDKPNSPDALHALAKVPAGHGIDDEGEGDIMRVTGLPQAGERVIEIDGTEPEPRKKLVVNESMKVYPRTYTVDYYGYNPRQVAITFDDGPHPEWTPKILAVLKEKNVKATFFMIGSEASKNVGLMQRVMREGHEIGNHTYFHPDIAEISKQQLNLELTLTERLFASKLGVQPLYFRPPYDIDEEPETDDQAEPIVQVQNSGFIVIGNKIDTDDWHKNPTLTPEEITGNVFEQLARMQAKPWFAGSVILMHDGGGDRTATVEALPVLIDALREHGYQIVPIATLMGKTRDQVMPPLSFWQRVRALPDSLAFTLVEVAGNFIMLVFFVGDVLMSARLILIGVLAVIDRLRRPHRDASPGFHPRVAVLVPAYNEEKVIVRTVRSVLNSDYDNLHVIVIDDGSKDRTVEVACEAYAKEIAEGRVAVITKPNGGKAAALNFALEHMEEEFYVGIDADTVIAPEAIGKLIPHFEDARIGAVAGNAKVGNRVNLWTRWQALEYITSQNFERRALNLFHVVTVVPGAIGAWRTSAVKAAGGYPVNTVAEDADLTMNLLEQQLRVVYEDRALAFTEAPVDMDGLMRQRFRWSFGILQAVWKHRLAFVRNKAMGLFALPNIFIFQMILPLVSPFIDLMFVAGIVHFFVDLHYHPASASTASLMKLLAYFGAFLVIDFAISALAFSLERRHPANKGDGWLLFHIWLQRFTYRQVFSVVLFKTLKRAIDGKPFNWDKLERTAKMSKTTDAITDGKPPQA